MSWYRSSVASCGTGPVRICDASNPITRCSRQRRFIKAYLRLTAQDRVAWQNRAHFAIAAQMMRRVLVDHAREHLAAKRPGGHLKVLLDDGIASSEPRACELMMVDEALIELARDRPAARSNRGAQVIRRIVRARGRGRPLNLARDGHPGMANRPSVAVSSADDRRERRSVVNIDIARRFTAASVRSSFRAARTWARRAARRKSGYRTAMRHQKRDLCGVRVRFVNPMSVVPRLVDDIDASLKRHWGPADRGSLAQRNDVAPAVDNDSCGVPGPAGKQPRLDRARCFDWRNPGEHDRQAADARPCEQDRRFKVRLLRLD